MINDSNSQGIVKYYGRACYIDCDDDILKKVKLEVSEICVLVERKKSDKQWKSLLDDLTNLEILLHSSSSSSSSVLPIRRYQLDIIVDSIFPYIRELNSRMTIEPSRYDQLKHLLDTLLSNPDDNVQDELAVNNHPALILNRIETIIVEIENNSGYGLWRSSLATSLSRAVKKQWHPILSDTQKSLQLVGSKLLALGIVEVIGRPLIMLYPIYIISQDALQIITELNLQREELSVNTLTQIPPGKYFLIIKAFLLLWACFQFMSILSMFHSIGYTCLIIGCLSMFISVSDERTKSVAPFLSTHMKHLDKVIQFLSMIEKKMMNSFNSNPSRNNVLNDINNNNNNIHSNNIHSNSNSSAPIIEEIDDDGNVVNHNNEEPTIKINELRQRKKNNFYTF